MSFAYFTTGDSHGLSQLNLASAGPKPRLRCSWRLGFTHALLPLDFHFKPYAECCRPSCAVTRRVRSQKDDIRNTDLVFTYLLRRISVSV